MDTKAPPQSSSKGSGHTPDPQPKKETGPVSSSGRMVRLSLPILPTFLGEECRDDEDLFQRWVRKYAELESWSDREKPVQLELHLKGRAECLLPSFRVKKLCRRRPEEASGTCQERCTPLCSANEEKAAVY